MLDTESESATTRQRNAADRQSPSSEGNPAVVIAIGVIAVAALILGIVIGVLI